MIDYGTSYFDVLKRYVRLQKEYAAYQRKMQMRFVTMIAICCGMCVVHLIIFMFRLLAVFGILAFWSILGLVIILLALPISWNKYLCYPLGKALEYVGDQIDELYY